MRRPRRPQTHSERQETNQQIEKDSVHQNNYYVRRLIDMPAACAIAPTIAVIPARARTPCLSVPAYSKEYRNAVLPAIQAPALIPTSLSVRATPPPSLRSYDALFDKWAVWALAAKKRSHSPTLAAILACAERCSAAWLYTPAPPRPIMQS